MTTTSFASTSSSNDNKFYRDVNNTEELDLNSLMRILELDPDSILNVYLFGSRVYNTHNSQSDFDFMVICKNGYIPTVSNVENSVCEETFQIRNFLQFKRFFIEHVPSDKRYKEITCGIYSLNVFLQMIKEHVILFMFNVFLPEPRFTWKNKIKMKHGHASYYFQEASASAGAATSATSSSSASSASFSSSSSSCTSSSAAAADEFEYLFEFRLRMLRHAILNESNRTWQKCKNMYLHEKNSVKARKLIVYTFRYIQWGIQLAKQGFINEYDWGNHIHYDLFPTEHNGNLESFEYVADRYSNSFKQVLSFFTQLSHYQVPEETAASQQVVSKELQLLSARYLITDEFQAANFGRTRDDATFQQMMTRDDVQNALDTMQRLLSKYDHQDLFVLLSRDFSIKVLPYGDASNAVQLIYDRIASKPLDHDLVRICRHLLVSSSQLAPASRSQPPSASSSSIVSIVPYYLYNSFEVLFNVENFYALLFKDHLKNKKKRVSIYKLSKCYPYLISVFYHHDKWHAVAIDSYQRNPFVYSQFWYPIDVELDGNCSAFDTERDFPFPRLRDKSTGATMRGNGYLKALTAHLQDRFWSTLQQRYEVDEGASSTSYTFVFAMQLEEDGNASSDVECVSVLEKTSNGSASAAPSWKQHSVKESKSLFEKCFRSKQKKVPETPATSQSIQLLLEENCPAFDDEMHILHKLSEFSIMQSDAGSIWVEVQLLEEPSTTSNTSTNSIGSGSSNEISSSSFFFSIEPCLINAKWRALHFIEETRYCFFENKKRLPQDCHDVLLDLIKFTRVLPQPQRQEEEAWIATRLLRAATTTAQAAIGAGVAATGASAVVNDRNESNVFGYFVELYKEYSAQYDAVCQLIAAEYQQLQVDLKADSGDIRKVTAYLNDKYKKDPVMKHMCFVMFYFEQQQTTHVMNDQSSVIHDKVYFLLSTFQQKKITAFFQRCNVTTIQ